MASDNSTIQFRDVPNYPGYRVGSDGSVWSQWATCRQGRIRKERWKQLKTPPGCRGYPRVNLAPPKGPLQQFRVHRLVLEAFTGPCPEGMQCRHLNGIKTDNRLVNLAWGTPLENRGDNHALGVYGRGEGHTQAKLTADDVREIRRRYAAGGITMRELAEEFGVELTNINAVVNRRSWKHVD